MSYKQIKWLILIIPTITIGLWEYIRHEYLLAYISMELGNWLTPAIVFLVSILLLTQLFRKMELIQKELNEAKALKAALEEREKIAREIHDGIAQSLFLLNTQINKIEQVQVSDKITFEKLKKNIYRMNTDARQAIANLRYPVTPESISWMQGISSILEELERESNLKSRVNWDIPEELLSARDKIELFALIRESLFNIRKHANASEVQIEGHIADKGWQCLIMDDGVGFDRGEQLSSDRYGIKMMQDRAAAMDWYFNIERVAAQTIVMIRKEKTM
ncbi:sensor histidine kinase [Paenibacillus bouchesdurhonensis]|uniref:sensor histidine kinase n=1 Tax=Paenibacillus bouchesdurhonensis TaxID=1870990 RepID=UPI000DA63A71|nr:histidine kinase [Paenibacillus bouchesdurhonensis]